MTQQTRKHSMTNRFGKALVIVLFGWMMAALMIGSVVAQTVDSLSAAEEARYHELLTELRCLVCQNQSLADSDAELAGDLRNEVLRMVTEGMDNEEIFTFMTDRYGSFVRYRPPFNISTALLWLAPFIVLLLTLVLLFRYINKRSQSSE